MELTPEEVAKAIVDEIDDDQGLGVDEAERYYARVTRALRAQERQALEWAAEQCAIRCNASQVLQECHDSDARRIRARIAEIDHIQNSHIDDADKPAGGPKL